MPESRRPLARLPAPAPTPWDVRGELRAAAASERPGARSARPRSGAHVAGNLGTDARRWQPRRSIEICGTRFGDGAAAGCRTRTVIHELLHGMGWASGHRRHIGQGRSGDRAPDVGRDAVCEHDHRPRKAPTRRHLPWRLDSSIACSTMRRPNPEPWRAGHDRGPWFQERHRSVRPAPGRAESAPRRRTMSSSEPPVSSSEPVSESTRRCEHP